MAKKLIAFHPEDLRALQELAEDKASTLQELMDEAVRDLLKKHGKFTDLRAALMHSRDDDAPKPGKKDDPAQAKGKPRVAASDRRRRSRR